MLEKVPFDIFSQNFEQDNDRRFAIYIIFSFTQILLSLCCCRMVFATVRLMTIFTDFPTFLALPPSVHIYLNLKVATKSQLRTLNCPNLINLYLKHKIYLRIDFSCKMHVHNIRVKL